MDALKERRRVIRADATRTVSKYSTDNLNNLSPTNINSAISKIQSLINRLEELDKDIWNIMMEKKTSVEDNDREYSTCTEYIDKLNCCLQALQDSKEDENSSYHSSMTVGGRRSKLKLPPIPLPEFSNREDENLERFLLEFEQIIQGNVYTEYERYMYLLRQLSGDPLKLVKSLELGRQDYKNAKELLEKAFADKLSQKYDTIQRLINLKFEIGDDPFDYISQMRQVVESFRILKIDGDMVLQYFIWNSLNKDMKSQFIAITNSNKPSIDEINEHLFTATERYRSIHPKQKRININSNLTTSEHVESQDCNAATIQTKMSKTQKICFPLFLSLKQHNKRVFRVK